MQPLAPALQRGHVEGAVGQQQAHLLEGLAQGGDRVVQAAIDQAQPPAEGRIVRTAAEGVCGAVARVEASELAELVITDSIMATEGVQVSGRIRQLPIAPLLGEAIKRIADESSVSSLFD